MRGLEMGTSTLKATGKVTEELVHFCIWAGHSIGGV
jgi:hypothetical protein